MTTNSVSKEQIEAMIADAQSEADRKPRDVTVYDFEPEDIVACLTELLSLRTSSSGVTSGEVATDEMVERARDAYEEFAGDVASKQALRLALTAALSSLHAQPEAERDGRVQIIEQSDTLDGGYALTLELDGKDTVVLVNFAQPQGTGSREAVAWLNFDAECEVNATFNEAAIEKLDPVPGHVEPLVPLAQLQAVERELELANKSDMSARDLLNDTEAKLETAEASLSAARDDFQNRVAAAHNALFRDDPTDLAERRDRFGEEANEVQQALGQTREAAHQLVDYTYDRAIGEPAKEIGAAALTLASLCVVGGYSMMTCAEADLEKLQQHDTIARIRAKRSTRHGRGPLPGISP